MEQQSEVAGGVKLSSVFYFFLEAYLGGFSGHWHKSKQKQRQKESLILQGKARKIVCHRYPWMNNREAQKFVELRRKEIWVSQKS